MDSPTSDLTSSLDSHSRGDAAAADRLMPAVYEELRDLAARFMAREPKGHLLQPTALVHEAYLRLIDHSRIDWKGKTHFFALAAKQMRRALVDHARERKAKKRGGPGQIQVSLDRLDRAASDHTVDVLAVHEALEKLAGKNPRRAKVVEMRFFGGLSQKEVAAMLNIAERTVRNDWLVARAWLLRELERRE